MSAVPAVATPPRSAIGRLRQDPAGRLAACVVLAYALVALGAWAGWWATQWRAASGPALAPMSAQHWLGTNRIGQDIAARALQSTRTAFAIGLTVAVAATALGALLGALAGFRRGAWLDEPMLWLAGVLDSVPFYLFAAALAYALQRSPYAMHVAMIATFWTTTARLVRGEIVKLAALEFVEAARALGVREGAIVLRHILPNTAHILLVQAGITFVAAIKAEVILSFLGLGVKDGVSWGVMIAESTDEILGGHFFNFAAASLLMFGLVLALNLLADALQDALDPRTFT